MNTILDQEKFFLCNPVGVGFLLLFYPPATQAARMFDPFGVNDSSREKAGVLKFTGVIGLSGFIGVFLSTDVIFLSG
jgi:hypothetical protein